MRTDSPTRPSGRNSSVRLVADINDAQLAILLRFKTDYDWHARGKVERYVHDGESVVFDGLDYDPTNKRYSIILRRDDGTTITHVLDIAVGEMGPLAIISRRFLAHARQKPVRLNRDPSINETVSLAG